MKMINRTLLLLATLLIVAPNFNAQNTSPRERLLFNTDWRFTKDDPAGVGDQLSYQQIKSWIVSTGNDILKADSTNKRQRPAGNLGENISYAQKGFNDRAWRQLNLPHDWGIEGPFRQEYSGETGKLPWWGVGWYRKHFNVSTKEKG